MKAIKTASCICLVLGALGLQTRSIEWRGIRPFHSTRGDVERLLGKPSGNCNCEYKINGEHVNIHYSGKRCGNDALEHWDVPSDTVLSITLYPKTDRRLSEFGLDPKTL